MPYQRSTQASGFKKRTGPDTSKQLRQYATALDKERKTNVGEMERQGVQMTNELTRIDALATKKDAYELQNLRNFSKTLNTFMDTIATEVIKPIRDQKIEDGVTLGVRYQQGDPDAIAKIEASEKQLEEIESRIKEQELKVAQSTEAIQNSWDKENYRASLEEEYRLLNIKKLGSNRALGFRKGLLMESATGWDAYRDSSLLYNEDNPDSTENIGTEDDPIIVGQYHRYTGLEGIEKKKAILGHLTNKYIVKKGKESGLHEVFIQKLLTNPILEQNAKFQQKEAQTARLEEASAASEDNKEAISLGIDAIDTDNGKTFVESVQKFILTEPANQRGMNTAGSKVVNSNDLLINTIVDKIVELDIDTQEDVLDLLETSKFEVPGITKTGEKQTLPDLWSTKFNIDEIKAKVSKEAGRRESDRRTAAKNEALGEQANILKDYYLNRNEKNYEAAVAVMRSNPKYMGVLVPKFFIDMDADKLALPYNEESSRIKLKQLRQEYGGNPIPSDTAILKKLHPTVKEEAEEKEWIGPDLFGGDNEAKASHNANIQKALTTLKGAMKNDSPSFTWSDENDQVTKANALIESTLRRYTNAYRYDQRENENYSLTDAVQAAYAQLDKEIKADLKGEILPTDNGVRSAVWDLQDDGFVNTALNTVHSLTATSPTDIFSRRNKIVRKTNQKITDSFDVDIFSNPDEPPVVSLEDFELVDEKIKPLWTELSKIDPLSRSPELLYTIQASKVGGVEVPQWDAETQLGITKWESIPADIKQKLIGGDRISGGRALQEIGVLDLDTTISTLLAQDDVWSDFDITEDELPAILKSLGLQSMNLDEVEANPQLLKSVFKKKILDITEQVQTQTTDQNQAIRMVFAGVKFGDTKKWNDPYTLAALNSYYSGDDSALKKLNSTFNMNPYEVKGVDIQRNETGVSETAWDINVLDQELGELEQDVPPKTLLVEDGFIPTTRPNPAYQRWSNRVQLLNDRKAVINLASQGFIQPTDRSTLFTSGKRLIGQDSYTELQNQVLKEFPSLKLHPTKGYIMEPATGYGRIGTKLFDAQDMLGVLILNELGISGSYQGGVEGDTTGELALDSGQYKTGSTSAGRLPDSDLVKITGYQSGDSSANTNAQTVRIRKDVAPKLESLIDDAYKEGVSFNFSEESNYGSGYRTFEGSQKAKAIATRKGKADTAAIPGYSTHNLGSAIDFKFSNDDATANAQLEWLKKNGPKYGFFPWSEGGAGSREEAMERLQNLKLGDHEFWHWDYRPDLMETN